MLFAHFESDVIDHQNGQSRSSFRFGNNTRCVFSVRKFELQDNRFFLTEIVNLNHRDFNDLYKKRYYVANKKEILRAVTMCCSFTPDSG